MTNLDQKPWKYCAVGNIVKTHYDENGVLRYGTKAFFGGTKVYLCGKNWEPGDEAILVLGKNRFKKWEACVVPANLIENVRRSREYKASVRGIMDNFEFNMSWWGSSEKDQSESKAFVKKWNEAHTGI